MTKEILQKRKKEFLDWGAKKREGNWSSVIPKANWISGYWDDTSTNQKIRIIPIKQIASNLNNLTSEDKEKLDAIPDNLFQLDSLEEFQKAKEMLNTIFKHYSTEVNKQIRTFNIYEKDIDKSWRSWEYSNFKRTNWAKEYEQYLKERYNKDSELHENKSPIKGWNRIYLGPPGTGKTFSIQEIKEEIIGGQTISEELLGYDNLTWKEIIYLAFKNNNFKAMTLKEIEQSEVVNKFAKTKKSKTPYGTLSTAIISNATEESTNTTYRRGTDLFERVGNAAIKQWELTDAGKYEAEKVAEILNKEVREDQDYFFSLITFHQSYGYEDFIEGIYAETEEGQISYRVKDGVFKEFCNRASSHPNQNFLFVIDEINRGNLSKIFGELITLIEQTKRIGEDEELVIRLPYSGEMFGVPQNIFILGTMNTADRSISMMDTALRRRFEFIEKMPDANVLRDEVGQIEGIDIAGILEAMNHRIEYLFDRDHTIGHAYFLKISTIKELKSVFENKIIPLLQEYFYEDYEKIQAILNDEKEIYIKKFKQHQSNLFGDKFIGLVRDYDDSSFIINLDVTDEEFLDFVNNIVVGE